MIVIDCQQNYFCHKNGLSKVNSHSRFDGISRGNMVQQVQVEGTGVAPCEKMLPSGGNACGAEKTTYALHRQEMSAFEDPTEFESYSETMKDLTESCSETTTLSLASDTQVERFMLEINNLLIGCMERKNEFQSDLRKTLEKAKARYASGGHAGALISMRRVEKLRNEVAKLVDTRCKLMEILLQVQTELKSVEDEPVLVDLELEYFRSALDHVKKNSSERHVTFMSDKELLSELENLTQRNF